MLQINGCVQCQRRGLGLVNFGRKLTQFKVESVAWCMVAMDLIEMKTTPRGNNYVLTLIDFYTKWVEAIPIPSESALDVARALFYNVFSIYGPPKRIPSDNGREFCNQVTFVYYSRSKYIFPKSQVPVNARSCRKVVTIPALHIIRSRTMRLAKCFFCISDQRLYERSSRRREACHDPTIPPRIERDS